MKTKIILVLIFVLFAYTTIAQTDTEPKKDPNGKKPAKDPWASNMLVDLQTTAMPFKGSLELMIQHRFSNIENGIHDIFGLYGASNIRMSLSYSILNKLMIGFATEKDKKYQEFFIKGKILDQTRDNSMPISMVLYGNAAINARPKEYFGPDTSYSFADRMSYFAQLIISRKFCNWFSLEVAPSWAHINKVDGVKVSDTNLNTSTIHSYYKPLYKNDVLGVSAGARLRFYKNMSFLLEYDQGFYMKYAEYQQLFPLPNAALAYEISTGTHTFQVFASTYRGLVPQQNLIMNQFDIREKKKGIMLGFNITIRLK